MDVTARGLIAHRGRFTLDVAEFRASATGTAVLGPNGAGKTTLLLALHGLIEAIGTIERPLRCAAVFARPAVLRGTTLWNAAVGIPRDSTRAPWSAIDAPGPRSRASGSRTWPTWMRARCRPVSASASHSPARSPSSRKVCSWTNRLRTSMRMRARCFGRSSAAMLGAPAARSSSRPRRSPTPRHFAARRSYSATVQVSAAGPIAKLRIGADTYVAALLEDATIGS